MATHGTRTTTQTRHVLEECIPGVHVVPQVFVLCYSPMHVEQPPYRGSRSNGIGGMSSHQSRVALLLLVQIRSTKRLDQESVLIVNGFDFGTAGKDATEPRIVVVRVVVVVVVLSVGIIATTTSTNTVVDRIVKELRKTLESSFIPDPFVQGRYQLGCHQRCLVRNPRCLGRLRLQTILAHTMLLLMMMMARLAGWCRERDDQRGKKEEGRGLLFRSRRKTMCPGALLVVSTVTTRRRILPFTVSLQSV